MPNPKSIFVVEGPGIALRTFTAAPIFSKTNGNLSSVPILGFLPIIGPFMSKYKPWMTIMETLKAHINHKDMTCLDPCSFNELRL